MDDLERVICFVIYAASFRAPLDAFDGREQIQLRNEFLERWP